MSFLQRFKKADFCKLLLLLLMNGETLCFANTAKSCIEAIRDLNRKAQQSYITFNGILEIQKLFKDQKNPSIIAKKLFEIVLRERTLNLSPEIQNKLSTLLKKKIIKSKEISVTYYNQESDEIYLYNDFPKIEPNYIYYASFIHEVEHALQNYLLQEKFPNIKLEELDTVGLRTQQEIGAMLLEFDFIRYIPETERKKALEEAQRNGGPFISEVDKTYFRNLLSGNYARPIDYIRAHQISGRYSVESIEKFFESFGH